MIAAFKLVPLPLLVALLLTASTFAQTVLWDFETAGAPPPGWTPGWNPEDDTRCSPEALYFCDMQHLPWKAEGGVLVAPEYVYVVEGEILDSFVLSPVFMSVASPAIAQSNGIGGPILRFSLAYDETELNNSGGRSLDLLTVLLLTEGNSAFSTLVSLPLNSALPWTSLDSMDGNFDHVIMVEEPIEAGVQYRLRVRAADSDTDISTFDGVLGIDNIAVTNGVIPGTTDADFDNDGDVDGRDFLAWQRNPGIGNLADWQADYGTGSLVATQTAVPEPSTLPVLMLLTAAGVYWRID
jgi:hypothetical protein